MLKLLSASLFLASAILLFYMALVLASGGTIHLTEHITAVRITEPLFFAGLIILAIWTWVKASRERR